MRIISVLKVCCFLLPTLQVCFSYYFQFQRRSYRRAWAQLLTFSSQILAKIEVQNKGEGYRDNLDSTILHK